MVPSQLAREAEQLRFRLAHHLGGDPERLRALLSDLEAKVPHHPIVRTVRAAEALPGTMLPGPPPELSEAAAAWAGGDPVRALALARQAQEQRPHARTATTVADLCWYLGRPREAVAGWQTVRAELGPLPPLEVRLGRAALGAGKAKDALERALQALIQNPLHGTATVLLGHAHRAQGREMLPVPLPHQVFRVKGEPAFSPSLPERDRKAWLAGVAAAGSAEPHQVPPLASVFAAVLSSWRDAPAASADDRPSWVLGACLRWEEAGVLDSYQWAVGLTAATADAFRRRKGGADRDRRFWSEAVLQSRRR